MTPTTYTPHMCRVEKDLIYACIDCIANGLEDARECLNELEGGIWRGTKKALAMSELYRKQIEKAESTLTKLKEIKPE